MFDAQNDRRQEPLEDKPKASLADAKFKKQIAVIVAVAVLLIVGIIAGAGTAAMRGDLSILPDSSQDEGSGFLGLKNPGSLKDIDPTTKEELREEFEARPPVTENDIPTFEKNITRYLNEGDFSGLDNYLREQMSTYQTPSEEDEAIDDWSGRFPLLRSDTQIAINLVNKAIDVPAPQFQVFSDPETLAAAILWSPITMKIDAFLDWSSLILPAPAVGSSIQLSEYVYDKPQEKLAEISDSTNTQYYDVRSYNAVVTGHQVRVTVVMGPTGYWLPYSVQDIGGTLTSNNWTKAFLKNELEPNVPYHSDLDEVCYLSPPDGVPSREENPGWYNEEGVYIGPGSEFRPPIIEQPEGEWETPTEVEATAEDEATPSEGTATPAA